MKKKILILVFVAFILIGMIIGFMLIKKNNSKSDSRYVIVTSAKFLTLQNDGGTHSDIRYEIDLHKKEVIQLEDYYVGFVGYKYKDKIIYQKSLSSNEVKKLKKLFDDIVTNKDVYSIDKEKTYVYYTFSDKENKEIKIYDKNVTKALEELLKK